MKFGARYCKECEAKMCVAPPRVTIERIELMAYRLVDRHENEEVNEFLTSVEAYMNNNGKSGIEVPLPCLRTGSTKLYSRVQVMDFRDRWMAQRSKQARVKLLEEAEAHKKEVETVCTKISLVNGSASCHTYCLPSGRRLSTDGSGRRARHERRSLGS